MQQSGTYYLDHIFEGDCRTALKLLPTASVDLIVTSPPYADQRRNTYGGIHPDEYVEWFLPIAAELKRVLKPTGSFVLNIKERVVNGERHTYVLELIIALRKQGWRWTEEYMRTLRTGIDRIAYRAVLGHSYGHAFAEPDKNKPYYTLSGQAFWEYITQDEQFYKKLQSLIHQNSEKYRGVYETVEGPTPRSGWGASPSGPIAVFTVCAPLPDAHAPRDLAVALPVRQLVRDRRVVHRRLHPPPRVYRSRRDRVLPSVHHPPRQAP